MAHFAQLSDDNLVTQVIVVNNSELLEDGVESEAKGVAFCEALFGGRWVQTSYNATFRRHYAGVGYRYDEMRDAFVPPQPFPSWTFDESTCDWWPPVPHPGGNTLHSWNENDLRWVEVI